MCSIQTLCVNVYILGHWEATKCCERQLRTKITDCNLSWFHSCFTLINCFLCLGLYIFFKKKVCWYCVNHKHKHQISTFQTVERGHVWLDNLTVDFSSGFNFYLFMELAVGPFHSLPITAQQLQRHTERKQKVFDESQWNSEFEEKTFVTKSLFFLLFYRWVC